MTGFLVNLLSPVFSSLGVSQADLTSYIEKLIGYVIAIFALLVVMIVVMVVAHKAKKGFRHVIRWQATFQTESSRGCQVIATKNMRLFYHENGLKPRISV